MIATFISAAKFAQGIKDKVTDAKDGSAMPQAYPFLFKAPTMELSPIRMEITAYQ